MHRYRITYERRPGLRFYSTEYTATEQEARDQWAEWHAPPERILLIEEIDDQGQPIVRSASRKPHRRFWQRSPRTAADPP